MHAYKEYGLMQVSLYEDIARFGEIATSYSYPVMVTDRFLMSPTPIPKFDNPKMDDFPSLQPFGAGREKRIYAVPPHTKAKSPDFDNHPFAVQQCEEVCALCGAEETSLDEDILVDT